MEARMIAEGTEEQLQRLGFDDRVARRIIDDEVREIGLAGDRAERREFGGGETDEIGPSRSRIGHVIQGRFFRRRRKRAGRPEMSRSEEHTSELQSLMRISYAV